MVYIHVCTLQLIRTGPSSLRSASENTGTLSPAFAALAKTPQAGPKVVQITSLLATLTKTAPATPLLATHFQNKRWALAIAGHTSHKLPLPALLAVLWHNNLLAGRFAVTPTVGRFAVTLTKV
jgi:hypothetical protein